jgi:hypothetical protein
MRADRFLRHRGLILVAAGGAVAEGGILALLAPGALAVAPQVTALPPVAAYHDLRWLFADGQSWLPFAAIALAVLLARAAVDAILLRLAWPRTAGVPGLPAVPGSCDPEPPEEAVRRRPLPPPRLSRAFWSCLGLTAVCWMLLSPAVTLAFGAAVLPFSWPLIGALPIVLGVLLALSHGGAFPGWWHRLPPMRAIGWLLSSLVAASAAACVISHLDTAGAFLVGVAAGLANARAWYGMAALAARLPHRPASWLPSRVLHAVPLAPLAAVLTLALVVGAARLMFTGTIRVIHHPPVAVALAAAGEGTAAQPSGSSEVPVRASHAPAGAVLVVEGWGTWCCDAAAGLRAVLRAAEPRALVRQFSYRGLDATGSPVRSGPPDDDLPLPELGDKIAAQVMYLNRVTGGPVSVVAESEGTLGVYAMLARHPTLPVGSIVLLSPIIDPGQLSFPGAGHGGSAVPPAALDELDHLVGTMSPYGSAGAGELLASVSRLGARYFTQASADRPIRWLGVIPLADALTLPVCGLPPGVLVVPALHGGLLGHPDVLRVVAQFIAGGAPVSASPGQARLRVAAEVITSAATAWRMPGTSAACP